MKRSLVFLLTPLILFGLETVNLIKDHNFEKDSELWFEYAGGDGEQDSAVVNRHDSQKAYSGTYSASSDTRRPPGEGWVGYDDTALVIQGLCYPKTLADIDSLSCYYSISPRDDDFQFSYGGFFALYINAGEPDFRLAGYILKTEDLEPTSIPPRIYLSATDYETDTFWYQLRKDVRGDLEEIGTSLNASIDSIFLMGWGVFYPPWRGQKIYWDEVRLMGYADYDVGIKEILSGDSLDKDTPYTPIARIKNFGRENAPDFSVIAEIFEGTTRVYYDSLPWSLTSDTEDTVTFAAFTPSGAANHTLVVRTSMSPDESDEGDALSKTLYGSGIVEPVTQPSSIQLDIAALSSIRYSIPSGEHGTITLYDPTGRRLESLKVQGTGQMNLKANLSSGIYFVKLESDNTSITRKAVVLR